MTFLKLFEMFNSYYGYHANIGHFDVRTVRSHSK